MPRLPSSLRSSTRSWARSDSTRSLASVKDKSAERLLPLGGGRVAAARFCGELDGSTDTDVGR